MASLQKLEIELNQVLLDEVKRLRGLLLTCYDLSEVMGGQEETRKVLKRYFESEKNINHPR